MKIQPVRAAAHDPTFARPQPVPPAAARHRAPGDDTADRISRLLGLLVALQRAQGELERGGTPAELQQVLSAVQALRSRVALALQQQGLGPGARAAPAAPGLPAAAELPAGGYLYTQAGVAVAAAAPVGVMMNAAV